LAETVVKEEEYKKQEDTGKDKDGNEKEQIKSYLEKG
jgi:hypothetical protein